MALDIIKDIVDAEARAEEMIKNAEAEAASLKAEAEKKRRFYTCRGKAEGQGRAERSG